MNHRKTDRLLEIVADEELPVVWFAEGGGGRPGDTDGVGASGLATPSFKAFARLAGAGPQDRRGLGPLLRRQRLFRRPVARS